MLDQTLVFVIMTGFFLIIIGVSIFSQTSYSIPPIPAGWAIGLLCTILGSSIDIAGLLAIVVIKKRIRSWIYGVIFGTAIIVLGIRNIINNPFELPLCPCDAGFYGKECLPCIDCGIHSQGCDDGSDGTGECLCDRGWTGITCSVCEDTFEGAECDTCKRGWDGLECDVCYPGYTGSNCDVCEDGVVSEEDEFGILCVSCKPGHYGIFCEKCPDCTAHDPFGVCKDNIYHENNAYDPTSCTETSTTCSTNIDCPSKNCRGKCVSGILTDGTLCQVNSDCQNGFECDFKTCCAEERYGDGTCECGSGGFAGPLCEPCPGFDGVYTRTVCGGHGTCAAVYVGSDDTYSHLKCECTQEGSDPYPAWTGATCSCLKDTEEQANCTSCADGTYGVHCDSCPGGAGISQCSFHGSCSDGLSGDGTCDCDVDITFGGLGGWKGDACTDCHSGDFYGNRCETCPGIMMVGCHTDSFLATLPGSGNCITSCGPKTCNTDNGICI